MKSNKIKQNIIEKFKLKDVDGGQPLNAKGGLKRDLVELNL